MEAFTAALTPNTRMVSVMLVQNETGIVQPIREICDAAHQVGALVHVDACQAAGKIPINVVDLGADALSIAGHKFSGPPGTGALFVRRGLEIQPLIVGAMQQGGRRAGTEAVMNCCAMGVACQEAQRWLSGNGPFFQRGTRGRVVQFIKMWCRDHDIPVVFHGEGSPVVPTVTCMPGCFTLAAPFHPHLHQRASCRSSASHFLELPAMKYSTSSKMKWLFLSGRRATPAKSAPR